jgi:hypothetical protein
MAVEIDPPLRAIDSSVHPSVLGSAFCNGILPVYRESAGSEACRIATQSSKVGWASSHSSPPMVPRSGLPTREPVPIIT